MQQLDSFCRQVGSERRRYRKIQPSKGRRFTLSSSILCELIHHASHISIHTCWDHSIIPSYLFSGRPESAQTNLGIAHNSTPYTFHSSTVMDPHIWNVINMLHQPILPSTLDPSNHYSLIHVAIASTSTIFHAFMKHGPLCSSFLGRDGTLWWGHAQA